MLEDPELLEQLRRLVFDDRRDAASAWQTAAGQLAGIEDMADVSARVLTTITGVSGATINITQPSIVAAHDLLPSQVEKLDPAQVLGLCLETGSASAHTAILARARGIPTVVGLGLALSTVAEGTIIAIDGELGQLWVSPGEEEIRRLEERRQVWLAQRHTGKSPTRRRPRAMATASPYWRISIAKRRSAKPSTMERRAWECCAPSFCFSIGRRHPTKTSSTPAIDNIAEALGDRPLVIRTLDIGGDKNVPYVDIGAEGQPVPGLARHPRDAGPARPVRDAASRHPARRPRASGGSVVADGLDPGGTAEAKALIGSARERGFGAGAGRRHDRGARGRGDRGPFGRRGQPPQYRDQRPGAVPDGRGSHQFPRGAASPIIFNRRCCASFRTL